jgi:hypothetical protein
LESRYRIDITSDPLGPTSILSLYLGPPRKVLRIARQISITEQTINPLSQFLYALKATETKRQWPNRLIVVFDFLGLTWSLDDQAKQFMTLCKEESVVMFHFDQPSQIGLVNIKHLLLGPIKNYESPNDILSDSRYFKDVPLNEQVLLEMDNPGSNYFIASVQFANGSQRVYSNIMNMDSIFTKGTSEDQVDYKMDNGEQYNILDDSDIDEIQSDPSFQQIASKIICSDLDNNGFQVCQHGLSTNTAATESMAGEPNSTSFDGTDSIFEDDGNGDEDDNNNDDNDND